MGIDRSGAVPRRMLAGALLDDERLVKAREDTASVSGQDIRRIADLDRAVGVVIAVGVHGVVVTLSGRRVAGVLGADDLVVAVNLALKDTLPVAVAVVRTQIVVGGEITSAGQAPPGVPGQDSSGSQMSPEPGLQMVVAGSTKSGGQGSSVTPVQYSSGSQMSPEPGRQIVVGGEITSAGQSTLLPVQTSVGSQRSPEPARQTLLASSNTQLSSQQSLVTGAPGSHSSPS